MFNCYDTILQQQQRKAIKSDKKMYLRGGSGRHQPQTGLEYRRSGQASLQI